MSTQHWSQCSGCWPTWARRVVAPANTRWSIRDAAFVAVTLFMGATAWAGDTRAASCVRREFTFDGIKTLGYASVRAEAAQSRSLYAGYPGMCSHESNAACPQAVQVRAGESVAIGKNCGGWAYVQYIRADDVIEGWMRRQELSNLALKLPFDDGEPGGRIPRPAKPTRIRVRLTKGQGLPVCEAYLQRLNQSLIHEPPPCGRPENDQVPGFACLGKTSLSAAEVNELYVPACRTAHLRWNGLDLHRPSPPCDGVLAELIPSGEYPRPQEIAALKDAAKISAWRFAQQSFNEHSQAANAAIFVLCAGATS